MKHTVPVRILVIEACELCFDTPQNKQDVLRTICEMMSAAGNDYFMSRPNLDNRDWFDIAIKRLESRLELNYTERWFSALYEYCYEWLAKRFGNWNDVDITFSGGIMSIVNSGDYRIKMYHAQHGHLRVGATVAREEDIKPLVVENITDPFYVSDTVAIDQNEDMLNVTANSMASAFVDTPDYLRLERDDSNTEGSRGYSRSELLEARKLANEPYTGVSRLRETFMD